MTYREAWLIGRKGTPRALRKNMMATLDGSLVPRFQKELAARIARLLSFAAERKRSGIGIFSRPEVDGGLASLAALMRRLDPAVSASELQNVRAAEWPRCSSSRRAKLKRHVETCTKSLADEAERLIKLSGPCLGVFPENSNWSREAAPASGMPYTPRAYFLNAVYRGRSTSLQELPILDRLFGGSAAELLASLLALSRLESELIRLSGHRSYFDNVFTGLLVGCEEHLSRWAEQVIPKRALPPPVRRACEILQTWLRDPATSIDAEPSTARIKFDAALHNAFLGLARHDVALVNQGAAGLFETWPRTDLAMWDGKNLPFINVPAIAIIRTARRIGLAPEVPQVEGNDPELVDAPDPQERAAPFALYPGIELMTRESGLEPATLFVNKRVVATASGD